MIDQAENLRKMINNKPPTVNGPKLQPKVYSIVSGKGGVGKTNIAVNLGINLSKMGQKVLILDADIGMSNVNIILGEFVKYSIFDALEQGMTFREILVKSQYGVDILSGGSDFFHLENLDERKQEQILQSLSILEEYDTIIIDNGAGISRQSLAFTILGDEVILITTPEPTAITDAYRILKSISLYKIKSKVKIIVNQVNDEEGGEEAFEKLKHTANEFLNLEVENLGYIYSDTRVSRAIMDQIPYIVEYPSSLAGRCMQNVSNNLIGTAQVVENANIFSKLSNRILKIFG